ncbi:hypothetical protein Moror_17836 [Moniliophthora roreri MCA 2997]|uniref:BTB domain-containing protein n=2 Tax=Moniliophthora roreri TaxID=221103 RepID=V2XWM9_MONRO|nr:hypothetical protein Moror_17836 [Moniliophthora roreri MCA 2997]KAI3619058.1 hypothetical protein WG66_000429 [Moniliophthora roreri]
MNSDVFSAMFTLPQGNCVPEGSSDTNPIRLDGVSALDFQRFAELLYPTHIIFPGQTYHNRTLTKDEWILILRLATNKAIVELGKLIEGIERILLSKEFSIQPWLWGGCLRLIVRPKRLTLEEASKIGFEDSIRLFRLREDFHRRPQIPAHDWEEEFG